MVTDKAKIRKEDKCTKQNNAGSKRLEYELDRIKKQQEIWLKEQSAEKRKLKQTISNSREKRTSCVSLPSKPLQRKSFSFEAKAAPRIRKKIIS